MESGLKSGLLITAAGKAWGAAALRGDECRCSLADPRWSALGSWWRLCGSAEVLGGLWVGAEECGRWAAELVLFACCLLPYL